MLKTFKNSYIFTCIIYMIVGLVLLFFPEMSLKVVCVILGIFILLYGLLKIAAFFRNKADGFPFRFDLIIGIIFSVIGGFLLLRHEIIVSMFPVVMGTYIIFDSFFNFRQAFMLKNAGYLNWWSMLILALVMILLGAVMLFNPFKTVSMTVMFIGLIFLFRGISNIISIIFTNYVLNKMTDES